MSENPEVIRADIEQTRRRLGYDVDAVADKVTPSHIAHRQSEKIKGAVSGVKDRIMGTAEDTADSARGALSDAGDAVGHAQQRVAQKAKGNPLAAGLIAFGAGLLVSSLIPPSEKEQDLAQTLKEKAEPMTQQLSSAASEAASHLKQPAQEALQSVKETATEATENVKQEAQDQSANVQDRAQEAQQNLQQG
jgi:gas vesicle protein